MDKTTSTELRKGEKEPIEEYNFDKVAEISPGLAQLRQKLGEKARKDPRFRFYSLYAHVYHIETLRTAWRLIRQKGQTPGIDGLTYEDIDHIDDTKDRTIAALESEQQVEDYLKKIQEELKSKTYKPMPVRRVYIPKPDGRKRPLGLPTIKDRLIQMAVLLIIEPIFESDFLDCSYGFRPNKSAHEAIQEIAKNLKEGRTSIYDADLKGYFDSIPHEQLMKCVRMRITDGTVLRLLEMWLKAPIVEKEKDDKGNWRITIIKPTQGTPQGGVISPLLANVYLHWFDKRFHAKDGPREFANARLVRYADDFVVMARYIGDKISNSIKYFIEDWLKLEINKEKTRKVILSQIGDSIDFLGFTFRVERSHYNSRNYIRIEPKKKAIEKAIDTIREKTSQSMNYLPIDTLIGSINTFLKGWKGYFEIGHPDRVFKKMDYYVLMKVEKHLKKRSQRGYKKPDNLTWYSYLTKELGLVQLYNKLGRRPCN
jgi:RNA-directed DNA polymerase